MPDSLSTSGLGGDPADHVRDVVAARYATTDLVRSRQLDLICRPQSARRRVCGCGCGRWWYRAKGTEGRPRKYATDDCIFRARQQRRAAQQSPAGLRGEP